MLTLHQLQSILFEKDREKQKKMIDELPEDTKEQLLAEAAKLAEEGKRLVEIYRNN